jgi:lauroyl/myristoyl acyltransferase
VFLAIDAPYASVPVPAELFGVDLLLAPGAARLSQLTGAPIVTAFFADNGHAANLVLEIGAPLFVAREAGEQEVREVYEEFARRFEAAVLRHPHMMRWKPFRNSAKKRRSAAAEETAKTPR